MINVSPSTQSGNPRPRLTLRKREVPDETFWILWNPANRRPAKRHATLAEALTEQARLQAENPGQEFWAYQCTRVG